jgi:CheY-like chemotaxis protein
MKPRLTAFALDGFLKRIETDYHPLAAARGLKLTVLPSRLTVKSDPMLLRRLVQNLVSNAIKYTVTGKILVGVRPRGREAWIEVYDTGIGIPASKFKTVFNEFSRLDEGAKTASGLGLGLSIVDRIARVLSHKVELQSTPGRGTLLRVRLPRDLSGNVPATLEAQPAASGIDRRLDGLNVLCIDNDETILDGMKTLLEGWGCRVALAKGLGALADLARPDIVIADYHLDDGTGIDAVGRLRDRFGPLPAMLITADRTAEVRAGAEREGMVLLNKPVKPAALRATLNRLSTAGKAAAE